MNEDLDAAVVEIKNRIAAAQRSRVRAEHERDAAQAQADKARAQLLDEFGVSTAEEAEEMLISLEGDLRAAVEQLRGLLAEIDE